MHSMEWEMGTFSLMMYSAEEMKGTFYSVEETVGEKRIVLTLKMQEWNVMVWMIYNILPA